MKSALWGVAVALLLGCGGSGGSAGAKCNQDGDCEAGLSCLDFATQTGPSDCQIVGRKCSKACTTDADCADLGGNQKCFASCTGSESSCGEVQ